VGPDDLALGNMFYNRYKPPRQVFVIQLEEARAEWRRRKAAVPELERAV